MPHHYLISSYIAISGICSAVMLLHLVIFLRRRHERVHLVFGVMALCCALATLLDIRMHLATDIADFVWSLKATNTVQVMLWIAFAWFIKLSTHDTRRLPAMMVSGLYVGAGVLNLLFPQGILFDRVDVLNPVTLPWGETIAFGSGPANAWRILPDLAWFVLLSYTLNALIRYHRRDGKHRSWFLGLSIFACLGVGYLHGTLVDFGILPPPSIWNFSFLALIILMSAGLVDKVVKVPELERRITTQMERWQTLINHAKLLIFGLDPRGRIDFINPHFLDSTGYTEDDVIGRPLMDFVHPSEKDDVDGRIQNALNKGILPEKTDRALVTKDNRLRSVHWSHVLLRDHRNEVTGTLSIGEDITELQQTQQALADEKARMDVVLSTLDTGLALMDTDLNVLWVNAKLRQSLPYADPVGQKCHRFAENRDEPCKGCGALMALADGEIHETERRNTKNNRWYLIISMPIKDEHGNVVQVLESSTDITARKELEAARDRAMQELEALKTQLEEENLQLREELLLNEGFEEIVGHSNAILYVLERIKQVANTNATVLIQGETGVGKELVAGAIHRASGRGDQPFIRLNCAALNPTLIESDLFGHEAGAFTGAGRRRKGRFEMADGGTLLLDEISEIPVDLQGKLLRVLQEGRFERVGGSETISVDVRVIAATNRNLQDEVENGTFRADLYYRLNVYPITVPPLRKRREDIEVLMWHFLEEINARVGKNIQQVPQQVMHILTQKEYPGNVRELKNLLEHAVITSTNSVLQLPQPTSETTAIDSPSAPAPSPHLVSLDDAQRQHIAAVLEHTGGRIEGSGGAADILQIKPSTLRHRIKKLGIQRNG
jgi:PAS domain S-box-containing protein